MACNVRGSGWVANCMEPTRLRRFQIQNLMSGVLCLAGVAISSATTRAADLLSPATAPAVEIRSEDQQFAATADARTQAELALRDLRKLLQANRATADSEAPALPRPTALNIVQKSLDAEQRKSAADQDKNRIADLSHRVEILSDVWDKYAASAHDLSSRLSDAATQFASLSAAMHQVTGLEGYWKQLKMGLSSVEQAYSAISERAGRTAGQIRESIDAEHRFRGDWDQQSAQQTPGVEKPPG